MKYTYRKLCEVCSRSFLPDARVGERQRVCQNLSCQQERKRRAQRNWLAQNPDAFAGRYEYLKDWLKAHPGYLKHYRSQNFVVQIFSDIQDEITALNKSQNFVLRIFSDIQDEITACFKEHLSRLKQVSSLIYKTS